MRFERNTFMRRHAVKLQELQAVSARLGDVIIDPALWLELMAQVSAAVGATGAVLLQSDARTLDVPRTAGVEELISHYFAAGWHTRDLRAQRGWPLLARGAKVISDQDIVAPEEMRHSPYYAEAIAPFGFQWFAAIGFAAGPAPWALVIQRTPGEGPFEYDDKRVLVPLAQRLTEVATLSTAIGRSALSGITNALGLVNRPALAVDRLGFVLDMNAAAAHVLDDDVRIRNRRLWVRDERAQSTLDAFVGQLRATPENAVLPAQPIAVRRRTRRPVIIRVLPVDGAASSPFLGARAILVLTDLDRKSALQADVLARAFGLSPAEARLGTLIATGISPARAAEELGLARETVRNELKAVFLKTDTHRQSELVALLSKL